MSDLNFQPLLFGGDINVYSVARAFHEAYGVISIAYGKYPSFPCHGSAIIDYRVCPDNESADAFRRNVKEVAEEFPDKTILLLGCGDSYVQLAAHCKDQLPANVVAPYIDGTLLDTLINKEKFYQLCDQYGVDHPATFIYDKSMGHDFLPALGAALHRQARRQRGLLGHWGPCPGQGVHLPDLGGAPGRPGSGV